MRVVVLHNPIAGAGRAVQAADRVSSALTQAGHQPQGVEARPEPANPALTSALGGADALVVLGGDGTVGHAARFAIEADVPLCQFPFGTENLFAREFGMTRDIPRLVRSIEKGRRVAMDVGMVGEALFLMMVSIGFDADVIHDMTQRRTGAISHWSYLGPIARSLRMWAPADVGIEVDGNPLEVTGPGLVVVANARQHAFRFDPLPHARRDDGSLHVMHAVVPHRSALVGLSIRCRMRRHLKARGVTVAAGRQVRLTLRGGDRYQVDGDCGRWPESGDNSDAARVLDLSVRPGVLRVVVPA